VLRNKFSALLQRVFDLSFTRCIVGLVIEDIKIQRLRRAGHNCLYIHIRRPVPLEFSHASGRTVYVDCTPAFFIEHICIRVAKRMMRTHINIEALPTLAENPLRNHIFAFLRIGTACIACTWTFHPFGSYFKH
jgi:hypothetical protein